MTDFDPRGIAITPVTVGDLPAFLAAIEPIAAEVASGDILGALMRHADAVIAATAIGARVERAWLEQQTPDVLVDLAARVLEANADFFVQRVMPALTAASERIAKIASGGTPGWPASSASGSAIGT